MQDSPKPTPSSPRPLHSSVHAAVSLHAYREARKRGESQRDAARDAKMARSTLRDLDVLPARTDASAERDVILRSREGAAMTKQFLDAALFVFCTVAGVGLLTFRRFLELAGLMPYVASSHGALHARLTALEEAYVRECEEERARLGREMEQAESVVVGLDETYFGGRTCLVASDLLTGFLLLEAFSDARDRAAWNAAWLEGTRGLKVAPTHAVADGAKGIRAFIEGDLGVHLAPDLLHVLHDLGKAFACHLARREASAKEREEDVRSVYAELQEFAARVSQEVRLGRPIDFKVRNHEARGLIASVSKEVVVAQERREEFRSLLAELSAAYWPIDSTTDAPKDAAALRAELEATFQKLESLAAKSNLGEHHEVYLRKAKRALPALVAALEAFHTSVSAAARDASLSPYAREILSSFLVPASLLVERARLALTAAERDELLWRAQELRFLAAEKLRAQVGDKTLDLLLALADVLAARWQRTTSSIEGRNGSLSQKHHARRGLSDRKLRCATHVHNFFLRRSDGTSAAGRFFGRPHRDVAQAALDSMGDLKRPRIPRQAA